MMSGGEGRDVLTFTGLTGTVLVDGGWLVIRRDGSGLARRVNARLRVEERAPLLVDLSRLLAVQCRAPGRWRAGWVRPVVVAGLPVPRRPLTDPFTVMFAGVSAGQWRVLVAGLEWWVAANRAAAR